jgi:hypothetical protein
VEQRGLPVGQLGDAELKVAHLGEGADGARLTVGGALHEDEEGNRRTGGTGRA